MKEWIDNFPCAQPAWVICRGLLFARGGPKLGRAQAKRGPSCPGGRGLSLRSLCLLLLLLLLLLQSLCPLPCLAFQASWPPELYFHIRTYHIWKSHFHLSTHTRTRTEPYDARVSAQSRTETRSTPIHPGDTTEIPHITEKDNNSAALPFLRPGTGMCVNLF